MAGSRRADDKDLQTDSPNIVWPFNRTDSFEHTSFEHQQENESSSESSALPTPQSTRPSLIVSSSSNESRSPSDIAIRSFILGGVLAATIAAMLCALFAFHSRLWRPFFFLASLALFHFLEYWMTARFNPRCATVDAFLLSANGSAYNLAHSAALVESCISSYILPSLDQSLMRPSLLRIVTQYLQLSSSPLFISGGAVMMAVGQVTRSVAMAQAGTNFNHVVQKKREHDHVLVTHGIYKILRHPAYFGFFWFAIGGQVVMGNIACGIAYVVILLSFFSSRIRKEEQLLVSFFGNDYVQYRRKTFVGIPFIA